MKKVPATDSAERIAFSPDGHRIAVGGRRFLRVWEVSSGKVLLDRRAGGDANDPLLFSEDGRELIYVDGKIHFLDLETKEETVVPLGPGSSYPGGWFIAVSPDGKLAVWRNDDRLFLLDTETGETRRELSEQTEWVRTAAFSRNGSFLAGGKFGRGTVYVWEVASGRKLLEAEGESGWVRSVAFSPDEQHVAAVTDQGSVRVWDIADGRELWSDRIPVHGLVSLTFSPDGKLLATEHLYMWEVASGKRVSEGTAAQPWERAALSPDFRTVAWCRKLETLELRDLASNVSRRLTHREGFPQWAVLPSILLALALPIIAIFAGLKVRRSRLASQGPTRIPSSLPLAIGIAGAAIWLYVIGSIFIVLVLIVIFIILFGDGRVHL